MSRLDSAAATSHNTEPGQHARRISRGPYLPVLPVGFFLFVDHSSPRSCRPTPPEALRGYLRATRQAPKHSAPDASVMRMNHGSVARLGSTMMRQMCTKVSNPNTIPAVITYDFNQVPPSAIANAERLPASTQGRAVRSRALLVE
jgi:hypothetical protein